MEICLGLEPGNVQLWRSKPLSYIAFLPGFLEPHALLSVFRPLYLIIFLAAEHQRHLWSRLLSLWLQKDLERRTAEAEENDEYLELILQRKCRGFKSKVGWRGVPSNGNTQLQGYWLVLKVEMVGQSWGQRREWGETWDNGQLIEDCGFWFAHAGLKNQEQESCRTCGVDMALSKMYPR